MLKLISKSSGIKLAEHSIPGIGENDLLIETIGSCYSKGTESSTVKNHQKSISKKIIDNHSKIIELISKKDFSTLFKKLQNQQTSSISLGYSSSGVIISKGNNVENFDVGDRVVSLGSSANHSQYSIVPEGLCVKIGNKVNPLDASTVAIGCIALNSVILANPIIGSNTLVIGCGLLGQFLIQFLNISTTNVTSIDIDDWKFEQSKIHGASSCFNVDQFMNSSISNKFDHIFIAIPKMDNDMWNALGDAAKFNATISMLGAADLNCPRDVFYSKQLNFISPHSYGPGRGIHNYEILSKDFPKISNVWDIRSIVRRYIYLLESKKISTDFIDTHLINDSSEESLIKSLENNKSYSVILDWQNIEKSHIEKSKEEIKPYKISKNNINYNNISIFGYSEFAKESHIPNIGSIEGINLAGVYNRSPLHNTKLKILKKNDLDHPQNGTIVISSNHASHANNLLDFLSKDKLVVVDKPLCVNSKELHSIIQYDKRKSRISFCFMNRRYSKHVDIMKKNIENNNGPVHLDCNFYVAKKDINDKIYSEGGRLIGEMCHHVDLSLFLLGKPYSISYADNDFKADTQNKENSNILISFENGSSAFIRYSTMGSSDGIKESIRLSFGKQSIEITDFKKTELITDDKRKILLSIFDKGFKSTWEHISRIINDDEIRDNEIQKMKEQDILVSKILFKEKI